MNIFDVQSLQTTCTSTANVASGELDRRVVDLFRDFDLDPSSTLELLHELNGYISGSGVLHTINPGPWKPNDIDIYVPSHGASRLKVFLLHVRRRFSFRKAVNLDMRRKRGRTYTKIPGLSKIWYFQSLSTQRTINVMVTSTKSALAPIVAFHSTPVMNFITYFGVVSLYGKMTSERIGWMNLDGPPTTRDRKWIAKYQERGYRLFTNSKMHNSADFHQCGVHLHCVQSERSIHDSGVLVTTFTTHREQKKTNLLRSIEPVLVWRLKNGNCDEGVTGERGFVVTKYQHLII
ncbi:hypothetical protein BKA70DRAFT_1121905 [Coprinopsis sp. MPI-PUGE-AT-0042]|nr:hypothetical protein BKA70DRAFT_1121905 [Coprinopsis sp. MPI-PUGE-AT-0042]